MDTEGLTRRDFLRIAGLTSAGVLAAAVGSACAPSVAPSGSPTAPAAKAPQERVLKIAVPQFWGETFDPTVESGSAAMELGELYDGPFERDPVTGAFIAGIVDKWELAADKLSWTFHVRNDIVFHDGSKLTAADLKFSYEGAARDDPKVIYGVKWRQILGDKPRIDLLDEYTLRIYTNGPQPDFFMSSGLENPYYQIFPKAYIEKNGWAYFGQHPIGTGPYKLVRFAPGDVVELEAVDKHWSGVVPDFHRLMIYQVPEETTRIAMLETGQIDFSAVSLEGAVKLKAEGFSTVQGEETCSQLWTIGAYHAKAKGMPLSDVRVRQALSLAINRQEIIDTVFRGFATIPPPPKIGWTRPDMGPALVAKWKAWSVKAYRYDPEEAKRLLKDAGYANGANIEFWNSPDYATPYLADLVVTCASYWEKVGIHTTITNVDRTVVDKARNTSKSTDLVGKMMSDASSTRRPSSVRKFDDFTDKYGSKDYLANSPNIAEFDALWLEGTTIFDAPRIEQIVDKLITMTTDAWVGIPVVTAPQNFASGPRVGVYMPPFNQPSSFYSRWKYTGVEKLPGK
jgi:ABC-type transport system substrate-binding protein